MMMIIVSLTCPPRPRTSRTHSPSTRAWAGRRQGPEQWTWRLRRRHRAPWLHCSWCCEADPDGRKARTRLSLAGTWMCRPTGPWPSSHTVSCPWGWSHLRPGCPRQRPPGDREWVMVIIMLTKSSPCTLASVQSAEGNHIWTLVTSRQWTGKEKGFGWKQLLQRWCWTYGVYRPVHAL